MPIPVSAVVQAIEVALDLVERDQDLLQLVRVDADTRVGDRNRKTAIRLFLRSEIDAATFRRKLQSIGHQIDNNLLKSLFICS